MPAHHEKIEHFLIHIVAVLFLFSTLSTAFLGYGVYQTNQQELKQQAPLQPKPAKAAGPNKIWTQNSWIGGADTNNSYAVAWGTTGGWTKYYSGTNIIVDSSGSPSQGPPAPSTPSLSG